MSRAVSGVFGATVAAPQPSNETKSKSSDSAAEASAFSEALGRAQTKSASAKKAAVSELPAKGSASKTGKAAGGRQSPVKKVATQEDSEQTKVQKKAESDSSGDAESALGDESADAEAEESPDHSGSGQKKSPAAPIAGASQETPSAIVQLQSQAAVQEVQPTSRKSPRDEAGSKSSTKAVSANAGRASQSRAPESAQTNSTAAESSDETSEDSDSSDLGTTIEKSKLPIQPRDAKEAAGHSAANATDASAGPKQTSITSTDANAAAAVAAGQAAAVGPAVPSAKASLKNADDLSLQSLSQQDATASSGNAAAPDDTPDVTNSQVSSGSQFSDANHPRIISSITGRLLPNGGSMQIRLDPPELGAMQVRVEMRDGAMSASFETSNDQATRLLSHSLGDLRTSLAAQGVNVEKLQVTQSPKQQSASSDTQKDNSQNSQDTASQQEQQRKEMVRRMWQKLMGGSDPIDMVA